MPIVERPDEMCANRVEPIERPLILGLRSGVRSEPLQALKRVACLVQLNPKTGERLGVVEGHDGKAIERSDVPRAVLKRDLGRARAIRSKWHEFYRCRSLKRARTYRKQPELRQQPERERLLA